MERTFRRHPKNKSHEKYTLFVDDNGPGDLLTTQRHQASFHY